MDSAIVIDSLDIVDRILLAALMAALEDKKQSFSLKEIIASDFASTEELCVQSIEQLKTTEVLKAKASTKAKELNYELCLPNTKENLKSLISSLKDSQTENQERITILIFDALAAECIEYIVNELKKLKIDIKADSPTPLRLFELLSNHSSAEVHMILWQTVKNLSKSDLRILMATECDAEIIHQIVDEAYVIYLKYKHFNRIVGGFSRRPDHRTSAIHKILFTKHLGIGLKYFTELRL